jgi:flagellar hook-associated protein 1 FlgK
MYSTFGGIEIVRRSLAAHQSALNVVAHNLANANTPGYTRQSADLVATNPYTIPTFYVSGVGQIGTGVELGAIRRMNNQFVQTSLQRESSNEGYWQALQQVYEQLEICVGEPSDSGIRASMDEYWKAWQELHVNPENGAVRTILKDRASILADTINSVYEQVNRVRRDLDASVNRLVLRINTIGEEIASYNAEIAKAKVVGYQPNDLLDKRDLLLKEICSLTGATVSDRSQGMIAVSIAGINLVDGLHVQKLATVKDPHNADLSQVYWTDLNVTAKFNGGEIKAVLEGRDQICCAQLESLDKLALTLIENTNAIHSTGYGLNGSTGLSFFTGTGAGSINLSNDIISNIENIAASSTGEPGDGKNALKLARLQSIPLINGETLEQYYTSFVSSLGVAAQKAELMVEHQETIMKNLDGLRESFSGVNIDEEMTNMIMYQHAYSAAAKVMTAMDEILNTLINKLGLVGR